MFLCCCWMERTPPLRFINNYYRKEITKLEKKKKPEKYFNMPTGVVRQINRFHSL